MKKFLVVVLSLMMAVGVSAHEKGNTSIKEGVKWENISLEEALKKAGKNKRKAPKLVFVDCYATWCGPCRHMANVVFPMQAAGDYFNANFINIKIDMEKGEGPQVADKYGIKAYPTFLILDAQGQEIGRIVGGAELNEFIESVEFAKDIKNSPAYRKARFEEKKTKANAQAYIESLERSYQKEEIISFFKENASLFEAYELFEPSIWKHFNLCLSEDMKFIDMMLDNKEMAIEYLGFEKASEALVNACSDYLKKTVLADCLSREDADKLTGIIRLLADDTEHVPVMVSNVARNYVDGNIDAIRDLYQFFNFYNYDYYEKQEIERFFSQIKGISQEDVKKYLEGKKEFFNNEIKRIDYQLKKMQKTADEKAE